MLDAEKNNYHEDMLYSGVGGSWWLLVLFLVDVVVDVDVVYWLED